MMDFFKMTIMEIAEAIKTKKCSAVQVLEFFVDRCEKYKKYNAIVEIFDDCFERAKQIDQKIAKGKKVGKLAGVPIAIKDNICKKGKTASCASKMLLETSAPYSATLVERLENEDAVVFARCNMDEFAMGGSCEKSVFGPTHNALDFERVAGGSSGGSAVCVALGLAPCAIGTDTGGSIRQPASFNGVVGVKPTYGTVSRFGVVAFASSLDQASPICKTVGECEFVLGVMCGIDDKDQTSIASQIEPSACAKKGKVGIVKQVYEMMTETCKKQMQILAKDLQTLGFEIVQVDVPHIKHSLACYYVLSTAEASSNLSRFDAVKYGFRQESKSLEEMYEKSRSLGFGKEVKRRILLGNFVLSSGYFDAYYAKAVKLKSLLSKEFESAFEKCDVIVLPTTPSCAFKIGEKGKSSVDMFLEDLFTVPASLAKLPAISVPFAKHLKLPLGVQVIAGEKQDEKMFAFAKTIEKLGGEKYEV